MRRSRIFHFLKKSFPKRIEFKALIDTILRDFESLSFFVRILRKNKKFLLFLLKIFFDISQSPENLNLPKKFSKNYYSTSKNCFQRKAEKDPKNPKLFFFSRYLSKKSLNFGSNATFIFLKLKLSKSDL